MKLEGMGGVLCVGLLSLSLKVVAHGGHCWIAPNKNHVYCYIPSDPCTTANSGVWSGY